MRTRASTSGTSRQERWVWSTGSRNVRVKKERDVHHILCFCISQVRAVCGSTYMLTQDEEQWAKELPPGVEELLSNAKDPVADRSDRSEWG